MKLLFAAMSAALILVSSSAYADITYCSANSGQVRTRANGTEAYDSGKDVNTATLSQPFSRQNVIEIDVVYKNKSQETFIVSGDAQKELRGLSRQPATTKMCPP